MDGSQWERHAKRGTYNSARAEIDSIAIGPAWTFSSYPATKNRKMPPRPIMSR